MAARTWEGSFCGNGKYIFKIALQGFDLILEWILER
jgi:hypothetical protein